jgi:hypothetical protein
MTTNPTSLVVRAIVSVLVSGLVLAMLVPALLRRGITVNQWIIIPVVLATAAVIVGPAWLRAARERREQSSTIRSR